MSRRFAVPIVLVAVALLGGCGGDDTVNPTNPDAGPPPKAGDGGGDGSKDGGGDGSKDGSSDGAKSGGDGSADSAAGDAGDASGDVTHEEAAVQDASSEP